jgi:hypothetical protein
MTGLPVILQPCDRASSGGIPVRISAGEGCLADGIPVELSTRAFDLSSPAGGHSLSQLIKIYGFVRSTGNEFSANTTVPRASDSMHLFTINLTV